MRAITRRGIILTISLIGLLAAIGYGVWTYASYETPVKIGDIAPNIIATSTTGEHFQLDSLRGQPVLLNFFTPWCPPCIQETPALIAFAKKYGNQIHVVLIDRGDDFTLVRNYVSQYQFPTNVTVLFSPNDHWSPPYGVTGQPETFFIQSSGQISRHIIGPLTENQMIHLSTIHSH